MLEKIDFKGLFIRIIDYRKIILKHWVWLRLFMKKIIRNIHYFVTLKLPQTIIFKKIEYLNLIFDIF